jgi:hypothetical protein
MNLKQKKLEQEYRECYANNPLTREIRIKKPISYGLFTSRFF